MEPKTMLAVLAAAFAVGACAQQAAREPEPQPQPMAQAEGQPQVQPQAPAQVQAPAAAQAQAPATQAQPPSASEAHARDILLRMGRYLSGLPAFSVDVVSDYDVVQESGQKIEFGEARKLVVQRPDHLRADTVRSDGDRTSAVFTGTELALLDVTHKVYATTPQPGGLDESIRYFVSDLNMRFPMAMLLMSRLPLELERRVRSVDYVETSYLYGAPAHHLAARGDTVDFQVWVRDGDRPLPERVVITYRDEPGQPEFRAQFANWNTRPALTAATFKPQLPQGAQKVAFAAQLMALGTPGHNPK